MRRLAMPVLGLAAALLALSLAGLGLGEGGVVIGIFGVALGAVLRLANGSGSSDGDVDAFAGGSDGGGDE